MSRAVLRLLVAACVISLAAGAPSSDSGLLPSADVATDSAGVRIVTHSLQREALDRLPQWQLSSTPEWTFSRIPSREIVDLLGVTGAVFLNSGFVAVGHGSEREILLLDSRGFYLGSSGTSGSGPGEFRSVRGPFVAGNDELVVYDARQRRITRFDSMGRLQNQRNVAGFTQRDTVYSVRGIAGVRTNGDALFALSREASRDDDGAVHYDTHLAWLDSSATWRLVGPARTAPSLTRRPPDASGALGAGMSPLAPRTLDVVCGNEIVTTNTHEFRITRRTARGDLELIIRTDLAERAATVDDFALEMGRPFSAEQMQSAEMQLAVRQMHAQFSGATAPLVSDLHCDEQGNMFVALAQHPARSAQDVIMFAPDGAIRGRMRQPAALRILDLQRDRIAVTSKDNEDVESVSVWRITAPSR